MTNIPKTSEIKTRREELGLTQRDLAKLVGKKPSYISMIESEKLSPSLEIFRKFFEVLDKQAELKLDKVKTAGKICTKNVEFFSRHDTLEHALKLMKSRNFSQVPVKEGSTVIGLVTENSILKFENQNGTKSLEKTKVTEAITPNPPVIDWDQPISSRIIDLLIDSDCILVSRDGRVQGIIAKIDAARRNL